ncbi:leucine-rich repeat domain-containing protein [Roseicella sp. DB1501]|uniref:leucine-rich repeat domain-containing protein n=1 Tax=Roseicella sp. DB1501 TaxID=2730925 RepID=UPI001492B15A|nr:leucine-rich repeat domain-containing protein [Roseicella sp. DB1501]NOG69337.1 hypothetical protein [Roseicella sp. DB1501]
MSDGAGGIAEARRRIAEEAERRTGRLDLRNLGLRDLPEELFRLTHLRALDLGSEPPWDHGHAPNAVDARRDRLRALADLEEVGLAWSDLGSLDFVAGLGRLAWLNASGTKVADLTPLASLTALQSLDCSRTQVADLTLLASLTALQSLVCSDTQVVDLTPLAGLASLQRLDCSDTQVADLTPIAGLAALQSLGCSGTQVADLTPIAGLAALQSLGCSGTQVADLTPLARLAALQSLGCSRTQVADLTPIAGLTALQRLDCYDTPVANLAPLSSLTALQSLDCSDTQVADLTPIAGLDALQHLDCSSTQVADLTPIAGLTALRSLDCSDTQVANLTPIAGLTALRSLDCSDTQVANLTPIAGLTMLWSLDCSSTQVADLTPIAGLTMLWSLDCFRTQVANLTPIAGLDALQRLDCSSTQVADLTPIAGLTALRSLDCSSTQVTDLAPVLSVSRLIQLECRSLGLRKVPEQIDRLERLYRLDLRNNALTSLPRSLGRLTALGNNPGDPNYGGGLHLQDNPLEPPLPQLIAPGEPEATRNVLAWLRGELEPAAPDAIADPLAMLPALPQQGAGGQVVLDAAGAIAFAPPGDLDAEGNNLRRLRSLHPELCDLARTLRAALDRDNRPHDFLLGRVGPYLHLLDRPLAEVDFDRLFNAGVRLENAIRATGRQIAAGELPPLGLEADEAAESLLSLHALFILATRTGQEALEEAPRYTLTQTELAELRAAIGAFVAATQGEPTLVKPEVAAALRENAPEIGAGAHPERSTLVGAGMARNVTIVSVAAGLAFAATAVPLAALGPAGGLAGSPATLVAIEALKKSKPFAAVIDALRGYLDRAAETPSRDALAALGRHREFALRLEPVLRRLAAFGGQFGFLDRALDRLREPLPPPSPRD